MSTAPNTLLTPEQYLEIERAAPYKSEYFNGEMFAMSGGRAPHNLIAMNTGRELSAALRARPCRVYGSDMRVRTSNGLHTYPDLVVTCGKEQFADATQDVLLNPLAIVEVLSPSTEAYDRGKKFASYRTIPSLCEYLLLASDGMDADLHVRRNDGTWLLTSVSGSEGAVTLDSVGCTLKLADLYEKVQFEL